MGRCTHMKNEKDMPMWARVIAALVGLLLFPGGVAVICFARPLDWPISAACVVAILSGVTLLSSAIFGWWPPHV